MSRKDIWKDGKQFSSTYQPPNKNKRVPKFKARLKKLLMENYDEISQAIIKDCKKGSIKHIEFVRDWLYGKVKDEVKHEGTLDIKVKMPDEE